MRPTNLFFIIMLQVCCNLMTQGICFTRENYLKEELFSQYPVRGIDNFDAVIISRRHLVERQNGFGIIIPDTLQGLHFPFESGRFKQRSRYLKIVIEVIFLWHESDLCVTDLSDVHRIAAAKQFQVDYIF